MGTLVEKQDETIYDIEATAQTVEVDMEKGFVHLFHYSSVVLTSES